MKAGSSYLYDALMRHPQMVRTLQGAAFKETGCYLPEVSTLTLAVIPHYC